MTSANRPSWILFLLGMGQALGLCLGILVLFLIVVPGLPEPSAASAGLFTLIVGWVLLRPILEQRRAERSERNSFIPPLPYPEPTLAPAPPAMAAREAPSKNRWAFDRWVGVMATTTFVITVLSLLGPQWMKQYNGGVAPKVAGPETPTKSPPGAGSLDSQPTSVGPPPAMPPPAIPPPVIPPADSTAAARPPATSTAAATHRVGPDDLLALVPRDTSPARSALRQGLDEQLKYVDSKLFWEPSNPADHPPTGQDARDLAERVLAVRAVQGRELPSSSDSVKFAQITIEAMIFTKGVGHPFQCAHNGLGPSMDVALQQAADRCVRELLDQLGF